MEFRSIDSMFGATSTLCDESRVILCDMMNIISPMYSSYLKLHLKLLGIKIYKVRSAKWELSLLRNVNVRAKYRLGSFSYPGI